MAAETPAHTPTPYRVTKTGKNAFVVRSGVKPVAEVWHNGDDAEANANFIRDACNAYGRSGEDHYEDWKAKALAEVPEGIGAATLPEALRMLETWGPDLFPAAPDGRIHFGRALLDAAIDSIRQHLAQASEKAEAR